MDSSLRWESKRVCTEDDDWGKISSVLTSYLKVMINSYILKTNVSKSSIYYVRVY